MNFELQIIRELIFSHDYYSKVYPFIRADYFVDPVARRLFMTLAAYIDKYSVPPSVSALRFEIQSQAIEQEQLDAAEAALTIVSNSDPAEAQWAIDKTEQYCRERAIHNALKQSITILGDQERENGEIADVLQQALAVSFDTRIGHSLFDDAEQRYDQRASPTAKLPFALDILNRATNGGVPAEAGTLNIIIAGCVHPETEVLAEYQKHGHTVTRIETIRSIVKMLDNNIDVAVLSPDGMVTVNSYVYKGLDDEYIISTANGNVVRTNATHLIETTHGWLTAAEISMISSDEQQANLHCLTLGGYAHVVAAKSGNVIPVYDLVVDHDNHRYWTNGISSHNTNVGKSMMLCDLATQYVQQGKNVVYFTMEMSEAEVAKRIEANLLDVSLDDFDKMPKQWYLDKIAEIKGKTSGDVRIQEYPSGAPHVGHFRHYIKELKTKFAFVPDVIIVDYLNICASSKYKAGSTPKHQYVKEIAIELRALGQEQRRTRSDGTLTSGIPVFTAMQLNREGFGESDPDLTDVAESFGAMTDGDWIIVLVQPPEFEQTNRFLVKQEKSRYSDKTKMRQFVIGVDKDKQRLYDIDEQPQLVGNLVNQPTPLPVSSTRSVYD